MGMMKEILINEYDESLEKFRQLETIVADLLAKTLEEGGIRPMQIAHRIKSRDSAMEKLERKPEKYSSINSLTDMIGFRIICYFNEQVDQMAELAKKHIDYAFFCCDGVYNMDLEEAAECAALVQAKHNIPYHIVEAEDPDHFDAERAEQFAAPDKMVLQPGDEITL